MSIMARRRSRRPPSCLQQRRGRAVPACAVRDGPAGHVDRSRGGLALQGRLAAVCARRQVRAGAPLDDEANCLATAVYFEARGEPRRGPAGGRPGDHEPRSVGPISGGAGARGQAAGAILVRPPRRVPGGQHGSAAWAQAQAITRLAVANVVPSVDTDVLWYHANYVAPSWGRRLSVVKRSARTSSTARNRLTLEGRGRPGHPARGAFFVSAQPPIRLAYNSCSRGIRS